MRDEKEMGGEKRERSGWRGVNMGCGLEKEEGRTDEVIVEGKCEMRRQGKSGVWENWRKSEDGE